MTMCVGIDVLKEKYPSEFDRAYAQWQQYELGYHWWEDIYEMWVERLAAVGVHTSKEKISFSGFWSQGDGASFDGYVCPAKFWEAHGGDAKYWPLIALYKDNLLGNIYLNSGRGRYTHPYNVTADEPTVDIFPGDTVRAGLLEGQDAAEVFDELVLPLMDSFTTWVLDTCRDYMHEIYAQLEEEYTHLMSEESFVEHARINELEFEVEAEEEEA